MKNNATLSFVVQEKVYDDLGGFEYLETTVQPFDVYLQPVKREHILKEYGFVTTKPYRLVTKQRLSDPLVSMMLTDGTIKYKILEYLNLKYGIMLIEVINS